MVAFRTLKELLLGESLAFVLRESVFGYLLPLWYKDAFRHLTNLSDFSPRACFSMNRNFLTKLLAAATIILGTLIVRATLNEDLSPDDDDILRSISHKIHQVQRERADF
ncbi:hypothetical protein BABINDRAFT_129685 [Babjeviella inositovora NRRL Y-12698]|uniref:Uncharacterized protein n=1 Tax=Babjeviella inositovora NRRL Y-12698 TaxID=984486 RepID=A0A1E3QRB7_9ASCO|nr:uncharacterized protein BABINDRAFT_129685 [Babjeviella inositovora NRRL Y-12698]ODQ80190.1 hypothetical protein BABINDRAFT_129685 [Babjeviella inositovora NRRL Y-12698]